MTSRERDERDARVFAADALAAARLVMAAPLQADPGVYFMAVFTLLAVGALCPEVLVEPVDADA
jgi:hypothetical protein